MDMTERILWKMDRRCRLGWIDHSTGSWDWRIANARATRIIMRRQGVRLTLQQAMSA